MSRSAERAAREERAERLLARAFASWPRLVLDYRLAQRFRDELEAYGETEGLLRAGGARRPPAVPPLRESPRRAALPAAAPLAPALRRLAWLAAAAALLGGALLLPALLRGKGRPPEGGASGPLVSAGPAASPAVAVSTPGLNADQEYVRFCLWAKKALEEQARQLLDDPAPPAELAERLRRRGPLILQALAAAAQGREAPVRRRAIALLRAADTREAARQLVLLVLEDEELGGEAAVALSGMREASALASLLARPELREKVLAAIGGEEPGPAGRLAVRGLLARPDTAAQALPVLAGWRDGGAAEAIGPLLEPSRAGQAAEPVVQAAMQALAELGAVDQVPRLARLLWDKRYEQDSHNSLVRLVGSDLGPNPGPWLAWWQEQRNDAVRRRLEPPRPATGMEGA